MDIKRTGPSELQQVTPFEAPRHFDYNENIWVTPTPRGFAEDSDACNSTRPEENLEVKELSRFLQHPPTHKFFLKTSIF